MSQIKILSIDGGGTRGVIPARILNRIYQDRGKAPTLLRGKNLGLDVKRRDLLEVMVQYAEAVYNQNKDEILDSLDLRPLV